MSQIRISVVIPTCHRNKSLAKCLDCLAPGVQTLAPSDYEVIVTDDGSRTTAEQLIREHYPWVKWVGGPRKGPAANRNSGACYVQGEWLVFTDDDCLPSTHWLEAFSAAIAPDTYVYEGKTTCDAGLASPLEHAPINLTGGYLWSCNMMICKRAFDEMGGFDEGFPTPHMEDVDFRERLLSSGYKFPLVELASVDHPPRRVPPARRLGAGHESEVLFWYKQGNTERVCWKLMSAIIRQWARNIIRRHLGWDSVVAVVYLILELQYVAARINGWERKYRTQFSRSNVSRI